MDTNRNNQQKLLHILRNDALGGLEHSTYNVARFLAAEGIEQEVLFLNPLSSAISEQLAATGISVHSLAFTKRSVLSFAISYIKLLRAIKPDVLLINGAFGLHALLAALAWIAGIRRCWTYLIMPPALSGIPHIVQKVMAHAARPFTCGAFSVSDYLGDIFTQHIGLPQVRIHTIYRWRNLQAISQQAEQARLQRVDTETLVLCAAGRLDWTKDWPTILRAVAMTSYQLGHVRLEIAGDGQRREELLELAKELGISNLVQFHGHITDIPAFLGRADIFLFATSATEGIGNVLIESMAAGTAIISPDIGPAREVLNNGQCGLLVTAGNPSAFYDAILQLSDAEKRAALAKEARTFAHSCYTAEISGKRLYQYLFPTQSR